jgi:hypothetical protein
MFEKRQGFIDQDDDNGNGYGDGGKCRQKQGALDDPLRQVTPGLVGETGRFLVHWREIPEKLAKISKSMMVDAEYDN